MKLQAKVKWICYADDAFVLRNSETITKMAQKMNLELEALTCLIGRPNRVKQSIKRRLYIRFITSRW